MDPVYEGLLEIALATTQYRSVVRAAPTDFYWEDARSDSCKSRHQD